ncbi:MAG: PDZ domain-containing protein [Bacteroidales bacterium]|jgi:carboxyl-terminal processing protease|nr:PDZ domain-containing protein [Bacteroidales bacterium]
MKRTCLIIATLLFSLSVFSQNTRDLRPAMEKSNFLLQLIHHGYVDIVPLMPLVEKGTIEILKQLDPHSQYISPQDVARANEQLQGNFEGIGVSFHIVKDTIVIIEAISGGPSERLGIQGGDKIVTIDGMNATGDSARNDVVFRHLRGRKGTVVTVGILRNGVVQDYRIVRDKIPIFSVETFFMENANTGYIQVDRFSRQTAAEFKEALQTLIKQGAKNIILDLRGNSGGYMDQGIEMVNQFLEKDLLIVYMEGAHQPRQNNMSTSGGAFKKGKLVVLIDEGSASASEIVAGAIQDHDRGIIVGRRSFGKGLVQRPFRVPVDSSEIRLTIARYYTPSGRSVQKPYEDGFEKYFADMMERYRHGKMVNPDSIRLPDSLKFRTAGNRIVYGGGGIMPDIFTPMDTNRISDYYVDLRRTGTINRFVMEYMDRERRNLLENYPTFELFYENFQTDGAFAEEFEVFAEEAGVRRNRIRMASAESFLNRMVAEMKKDTMLAESETYHEYVGQVLWSEERMREFLMNLADAEDAVQQRIQETSDSYILLQLKALLARNLYGTKYYFQTIRSIDEGYQRALKVVEDEKLFKKMNISF